MATTKEKFDSISGFSVDKTVVVDEFRNGKDLNTLEIKNSFYSDSSTINYILRGVNTAILQLDDVGTQIPIGSSTLNFITGHIIAVNPQGSVYSAKLETILSADVVGNTSVLSSMRTVIKDDIPGGQTWDIQPLDLPIVLQLIQRQEQVQQTQSSGAFQSQVVSVQWS